MLEAIEKIITRVGTKSKLLFAKIFLNLHDVIPYEELFSIILSFNVSEGV